MKCPYCAEEINSEAIICRYCRQNLSLARENELLRERLSSLEERVDKVLASRDTRQVRQRHIADTEQLRTAQTGREAVLFVPGLKQEPDKTITEVSQHIADALAKQAGTGQARYLAKKGKKEEYQGHETATMTIVREDELTETPLIDIYEMSYAQRVASQYEERNPIRAALSVSRMLFSGFIKSIKALTKGSMSLSEKFHIVYAAGIGILLIIYVFVLLSTVVATAGELLKPLTPLITAALGDASNPTLEYIQSLLGSLLPYLQVLAVISLGLGLFSLKSPRQLVGETSVAFMSTTDYLAKGEIRSDLTDQVYSLLQHVHAKKDVRYQRIHIFAYSFGSIIAIDAVFPSGEPAHWTRNIDTLVTIGCPFDFVRTYWDDYFEYRHSLDGVPREWLNVYVTADVWATDFDPPDRKRSRPTKRGGPRTEQRGIVLETGFKKPPNDNIRLGKDRKLRDYFLSWFTLIGIRLHYSYWGKKNPHVENCFDLIVPKVYKGDHAPRRTISQITEGGAG